MYVFPSAHSYKTDKRSTHRTCFFYRHSYRLTLYTANKMLLL